MGMLHDALTLLERSQQPLGGRPRRDPTATLHAKIIWSAWVYAEGGEGLIRDRFMLRRSGVDSGLSIRSDEIAAYRQGARSFSRARTEQLVALYPALGPIIEWPTMLLSAQELSAQRIEELMRPYRVEPTWPDLDPYAQYLFPGDKDSERAPVSRRLASRDLERLFERGDPYGFFAIAEAYRSYHLDRSYDNQWFAARYLIRALPAFCRHPFVRPHAGLAISLVKRLLILLPDTSFRIRIDDQTLWRQIEATVHEPCRELRLEARTGRHLIDEPAEPIVHYKYVRCDASEAPVLPSL